MYLCSIYICQPYINSIKNRGNTFDIEIWHYESFQVIIPDQDDLLHRMFNTSKRKICLVVAIYNANEC